MQQRFFRGHSSLDQVRIREGDEPCRAAFQAISIRDKRQAAMLLNDRRLTFPCLYILSPQIDEPLYPCLRERLIIGLHLIERVRRGDSPVGKGRQKGKYEHEGLRWILDTGHNEDGLDEEYEEIMERAVSVLIDTYHDTDILPRVADMIFTRHREGRNIHDLTWAYFRSDHPDALILIARRLSADDRRDAALARRLLNIPESGSSDYHPYLRWLRDNDPYLYFTGESMQYASTPAYYRVDPERKYLQRGTPSYHKNPIAPAGDGERNRLDAFAALSDEEKTVLAEHSHRIHARDAMGWKRWMRRPVEEQIKAAKNEGEGSI